MRKPFLLAGVCGVMSMVASACLDRPVALVEPHTSNLFVAPIRNETIDKLDLLFMIDNSQSMGDKQVLLAQAVPQLVDRLVVPRCVDASGGVKVRQSLSEACPSGMAPEFRAVRDIHVAVITSSLGNHGAMNPACGSGLNPGHPDDRALLLPQVRSGLTSYANSGFLAWDPDRKLSPPGETDARNLATAFGKMVEAAGEDGCGYESSLEAWYRFLIDPEPPRALALEGMHPNAKTVVTGIDEEVRAQRQAFLRPDSLVAIVMLTDENDCSIRDDAWGYMAADTNANGFMWRANSACAKDPNDICCGPCVANATANCPSNKEDPVCKDRQAYLSAAEDHPNLRCLQNKRRFGYDFLYPTSRYINGLTQSLIANRAGVLVQNPLFAPGPNGKSRDKALVYLAGIVGVPWQDIADDASRAGAGLRYLTGQELADKDRWKVLLGDPAAHTPPTDPFMRESVEPRSGTNPITGDVIAPATSTNPRESVINGHEQVPQGDDLQYACTFQLADAVPCEEGKSCDCMPADATNPTKFPGDAARNRPLCQPPAGGPAGSTQYFGKAYPGSRPLEVLKGIGDAAIVASICPKVLTPEQPGYGYEPAVDAIVDRLKVALTGSCLPRPLEAAADGGQLPCVVVEANPPSADGTCSCNADRRSPASPEAQERVRRQLAERHECGGEGQPACSAFCLCELAQSEGPALEQCLNDEAGSDTPGYCYVDPFGQTPRGNPALVANCDGSNKRLIRFVGPNTPPSGATAFIACLGAALH